MENFQDINSEEANHFFNESNILKCRSGDVSSYLRQLFDIQYKNDTLDILLLKEVFLKAKVTGIDEPLLVKIFALPFDKNWTQTCKVISFFLESLDVRIKESAYGAWLDRANEFLCNSEIGIEERKAIAIQSLDIASEALKFQPTNLRFLGACAEIAIAYPEKDDDAFPVISSKGLEGLNQMYNVFEGRSQDLLYVKLLILNFFYLTRNWQKVIETYQTLTDLQKCECEGPYVRGLKFKLEISKQLLR